MVDILISVEADRRARRLRQSEVALALQVSQGHYSKVMAGLVPLSRKLEKRMLAWMRAEGDAVATIGDGKRMRELAISIRDQCMELMHLAERTVDERASRRH
jgi:hypothetical protein